ncbi:6651_t:CDS:2, partial [Ambispora leptoticha]
MGCFRGDLERDIRFYCGGIKRNEDTRKYHKFLTDRDRLVGEELSRRGILKSGLSTAWLDDLTEEWEKIHTHFVQIFNQESQSSSTSVPVIPSSDLPTVEGVRGFNAEELNGFLKRRLNGIDNHINTLTDQEVDGEAFLDLTPDSLKAYEIPLGATSKIVNLINKIQNDQPVA